MFNQNTLLTSIAVMGNYNILPLKKIKTMKKLTKLLCGLSAAIIFTGCAADNDPIAENETRNQPVAEYEETNVFTVSPSDVGTIGFLADTAIVTVNRQQISIDSIRVNDRTEVVMQTFDHQGECSADFLQLKFDFPILQVITPFNHSVWNYFDFTIYVSAENNTRTISGFKEQQPMGWAPEDSVPKVTPNELTFPAAGGTMTATTSDDQWSILQVDLDETFYAWNQWKEKFADVRQNDGTLSIEWLTFSVRGRDITVTLGENNTPIERKFCIYIGNWLRTYRIYGTQPAQTSSLPEIHI